MWQFLRDNPFVVGALSGSLASYLLGLIVSHLRREKRRLGYWIESRSIVDATDSRISIKFEDKDVRRLDSHSVLIRNTGNRALTDLPVHIAGPDGAKIVEHELEAPDGAQFKVELPTPNEIVVVCDLLNPGETAVVGLTIADSSRDEIRLVARAEGLIVRNINSRSTTEDLLDTLLETSPLTKMTVDIMSILSRGRRQTRRLHP